MHEQIETHRACEDATDNVPEIKDTGVPPEAFVESEREERQSANHD
jgi:hypothetical protein